MRRGLTLVELVIVVMVIGILLAIAVPGWMATRERTRTQACMGTLRQIDEAKHRMVMERELTSEQDIDESMLYDVYLKGEGLEPCPSGGSYTIGRADEPAQCSIHGARP